MRRTRTGLSVVLLLALLAAPASAKVDWRMEKSLPLDGTPLDLSVSPDGKNVYVLFEGGEVRIYSAEGGLEQNLGVVGQGDRLEVSPAGDRLFLSSRKGKNLQIASIETVHSFDLTGSPYKGPADAPISVVVYSDFQ